MTDSTDRDQEVVGVGEMARRLGVPSHWLYQLVNSGQVPGLRAGRSWLLNPRAVKAALGRLAAATAPLPGDGGGGAP